MHTFDRNASDYATIEIQVENFPTKGPKIVASSCGNVTIRENLAEKNLLRIFSIVEDKERLNGISYHIEGSPTCMYG